MLQRFTLISIVLLSLANIYSKHIFSLKNLALWRSSKYIAGNPIYYIKAFDTLPHNLSIALIHHLIYNDKGRSIIAFQHKSALPLILLGYKLHQQQQNNNTNQHILRLLLANDQQVQLTPEQSRELIQNSATIQNLIQDIQGSEAHAEEIPLPLLTQKQISTLLSYIPITNALNISSNTLPILRQEMHKVDRNIDIDKVFPASLLNDTAVHQFKEYLTAQTIPILCDLIIAASYLYIEKSEHTMNLIKLATQVLGNKLLQTPEYQDNYDLINTLPGNVQRMLVQYLIDTSTIRYALCGNITDVITITAQTLTGHTDIVNTVEWSPDGKYIASSSGKYISDSEDNTIRVWDTIKGNCLHTLNMYYHGNVNSVSWSPDSKQIAGYAPNCYGFRNTVRVWDTVTGTCTNTASSIPWLSDMPLAVGRPENGTWSIGTIGIWDSVNNYHIRILNGHTNAVHQISWIPDNSYSKLATGSWDKTIKIWDITTGTCLHTLKGHTDWITAVAWSPDGNYIASGSAASDKTIKIWDAHTGACIHTLKGHDNYISSLSWSPDSSMLASGSYDNTIKLWSIIDKKFDSYLRTTLSWQQALLLMRIISAHNNQQDIDFTQDQKARHCYASLPKDVKRLIKPFISEKVHTTLQVARNLDRLVRANPARAALFGVGLQIGRK